MITIALGAAGLFVAGMLFWPLFAFLPSAALRPIVLAPLYGLFAEVLLQRAGYTGALAAFSLMMGLLLSAFSPLILVVSVSAGILAELVAIAAGAISGRLPWYQFPVTRMLGCSLYPALQFPLILHFMAVTAGGAAASMAVQPLLVLATTGLGILLGLAGCWLARLVVSRMEKIK